MSLQGLSKTFTFFAPAFRHSSTMAFTTRGWVVAACSGLLSQPMFGLTTTVLPGLHEPAHAAEGIDRAPRDGPVVLPLGNRDYGGLTPPRDPS